jgi:hypothetical protein
MAWDDIVFGVLTGGAYNAGKAISQAGNAADEAGDAISAVGSTVTKLGNDLSSFINELEEMITIMRAAPRSEDDLWDEEVERLSTLRKEEKKLKDELTALGGKDDDVSWSSCIWDIVTGKVTYDELLVRIKLATIREAIHEILCQEPGVIPNTVHNLQLILERFNTLEQPRIEDILDSVDDNVEELLELQKEIKKLFVVQTWKAVPDIELAVEQQQTLETLESKLKNYDTLLAKNAKLSSQLQLGLVEVQPEKFELPTAMARVNLDDLAPRDLGSAAAIPGAGASGPTVAAADSGMPSAEIARTPLDMVRGPSVAFKGKVSTVATQPMAMSVASALEQNSVSAYLDNYNMVEGRMRFYQREKLKIEKAIFRIKWVLVEEPGVIPKMLNEALQILVHVRQQSLTRVDTILDSINGTVTETTAVLANVNTSLTSVQGAFDFLTKYGLYIKIGLGVFGGLILLIMLMGLIVLFRMAFGF